MFLDTWISHAYRPNLYIRTHGCGLGTVWLRVIQAYGAQCRATKRQPEQVGKVRIPPKQKLMLASLQKVDWPIPVGAHRKLQRATIMVEPHKDSLTPGEWYVGRTLSKVHSGRVLVQLVNVGTMPISLPRHATLAD